MNGGGGFQLHGQTSPPVDLFMMTLVTDASESDEDVMGTSLVEKCPHSDMCFLASSRNGAVYCLFKIAEMLCITSI